MSYKLFVVTSIIIESDKGHQLSGNSSLSTNVIEFNTIDQANLVYTKLKKQTHNNITTTVTKLYEDITV